MTRRGAESDPVNSNRQGKTGGNIPLEGGTSAESQYFLHRAMSSLLTWGGRSASLGKEGRKADGTDYRSKETNGAGDLITELEHDQLTYVPGWCDNRCTLTHRWDEMGRFNGGDQVWSGYIRGAKRWSSTLFFFIINNKRAHSIDQRTQSISSSIKLQRQKEDFIN